MNQSLFTLGRQPALGMAELESLYGADKLTWIGDNCALLDVDPAQVEFDRLGGSTRLCRVLTTIPSNDWSKIEAYLAKSIPEHLQYLPDGKLKLGISYIGGGVNPRTVNTTGLRLKKIIKAEGRSVRLIPNTSAELNSAQIIHNQLTGAMGWELVLVRDYKQTYLAQTVQTQDIAAYTARDQKRPKRDARVGMLPPKLAQIIVNLATPKPKTSVWDPFCGTGVLLQEALLMDFDVYGSDLEPRMIEYSQVNLDWLSERHGQNSRSPHSMNYKLFQGDATTTSPPPAELAPIASIACETYLGRPLTALPTPDKLTTIIQDCDTIHRKFLKNIARQMPVGFRMCIAVPAWKTKTGFKHLKTLEQLHDLGYNRLRFVHAMESDLIYHRPEQTVARELVILERI